MIKSGDLTAIAAPRTYSTSGSLVVVAADHLFRALSFLTLTSSYSLCIKTMKLSVALSLLTAYVAQGAQDTAYYPGFSNPNIADEMYYREAVNVVQDVEAGEFDALYIKYHSCV